MEDRVVRADLREWALKGVEQRLVEIAAEAARIYGEFPELRDSGSRAPAGATRSTDAKPRRRKRRSLASRKRMAEAQRKRWAAVSANQADTTKTSPAATRVRRQNTGSPKKK
jgi:hypothetical protein